MSFYYVKSIVLLLGLNVTRDLLLTWYMVHLPRTDTFFVSMLQEYFLLDFDLKNSMFWAFFFFDSMHFDKCVWSFQGNIVKKMT